MDNKHEKSQNTTENAKSRRWTQESKKKAKKLTTRIVVGVSVALALLFVVFIFVTTNFMGNDSIVTETAVRTIQVEAINTTGYVIRDEELIKTSDNGVLVYQVSSGDKVTVNGTIATIFSDEKDAVNYQKICEIDEEISELEALNAMLGSSNVGLDSVNSRLDQRYVDFLQKVNERDFNDISNSQDAFLNAVYRKQIITGDQKNFDNKIAQLNEQKEALENDSEDSIGKISSKNSGYFSSSLDGYENMITTESLAEVKYSDIKDIEPKDIKKSDYIGKTILGLNWYLACPVSFEQANIIAHNDASINVKIPYATTGSIPAKVVSINEFKGEDKAIVVLECNYMSPTLTKIRNEAVEIQLNTYEGIKIPKKALHDDIVQKISYDANGNQVVSESKVQGVFVKYGSELIFKQVHIINSGEDYVICSEHPDPELLFNGTTITLYDEVVVEGDNLYNGKLID